MTASVRLPGRFDSRAVGAFAAALRSHRGSDLVIDGRGCTVIGALGLQTLMVAAATWRHDGRGFVIEGLPDDPATQIALMGIDPASLTGAPPGPAA